MKRLHLSLLLCLSFVLLTGIQARGGDLADILKQKGIITEEEAREAREDKAKGKTFKLLEKIDFSGDLRLRHDTQWRETDSDNYDRNRERFRLRFGFTTEPTETTKLGVRLASGSGYQNTTNQSYDAHARGKEIFIDKVYASWQPADFFKITGGKHENPLFTTPLVWDPDVNPEGYSEELKFNITDGVQVFANLGQWFIEELDIKDTDRDPTLLAYQLGFAIKPSKTVKFEIAGAYYDFKNLDKLEWDKVDGVLKDKTEFLGYNHKHGQQMIFDNNKKLLNEFGCWEVGAKLKVKNTLPVPFSIFANFIKNEKADINELITKGVGRGDSDPADLASYGGDDRDTGWLVGLSVGSKKKKGDWYAKYHYQVLEDYAFPAVFVDSDFHDGGTNNKGHYIHGRYFFADNIQARATGFFTKRDDESKDGKKDEDRVQLDIVINF
ncbi:MAG: putative porin [Proteobacteria bacterium]|nr:putative porin [Pseudomonadota bacterium]MBU4259572.1 putative porin [Pseudomonadota bacterium]MBU4287785.1 putative porin [Pseudomonadota bacterium]MBU4413793.1 putative porin [Pseudomonadota bacterium]MCG2830353.1 putative porin [Desulfobacteraceae bacterium]